MDFNIKIISNFHLIRIIYFISKSSSILFHSWELYKQINKKLPKHLAAFAAAIVA